VNCATHAEEPITGTCERCGNFVCKVDARAIGAKTVCGECAERPDVDYLEVFKRERWGKRDVFAWWYAAGFFGNVVFGALLAVVLVRYVRDGDSETALLSGAFLFGAAIRAALDMAYWRGQRRARLAATLLPSPSALFVGYAMTGGSDVLGFADLFELAVPAVVPLLIGLVSLASTRNKLFFRIEVSEDELKRLWERKRRGR
jgi:hypothetical protein